MIGVAERGGSDALPIIFLHGVGSDKSAWAPQLAHFGETRRAIALDTPGYGESDPLPAGEGAPHDRFAEAILASLDELQIERAHVSGLSLGGVVAIALADQAPQRVAALVLADTFAVHPDGAAILERSLAASQDMVAMARARIPALLANGAEGAVADELVKVMSRIEPAAFRFGAHAVWPVDQRDRAVRIAVPTLVLCGSKDRVTPPALSDELAMLIPNARRQNIDGAGHLPNLEQARAFNSAVDAFLCDVERS